MQIPLDQILHGDCLDVIASWPDGCVQLAYLDPPFNTGRVQRTAGAAYIDQFENTTEYLDYMRARIAAVHRVLAPSGSILLHCDWRTCHHLRLMLDEIFGEAGFVNHLIWSYGLGGSSPRRFARKHDDILFYAKGDDYFFDPPRVPATSQRMRGQLKKATDVLEIPSINNMADERVGYPTQKPLELLMLLVRACCPPGGTALDPFCGSGTTVVAAAKSGRHYIGIDQSEDAVALARERCAAMQAAVMT